MTRLGTLRRFAAIFAQERARQRAEQRADAERARRGAEFEQERWAADLPGFGKPETPWRILKLVAFFIGFWWVASWVVYLLDGTAIGDLLERLLSMQVFS